MAISDLGLQYWKLGDPSGVYRDRDPDDAFKAGWEHALSAALNAKDNGCHDGTLEGIVAWLRS